MRFSVIVPTYDRPDSLRACLQSLADLDYTASDFEVLVCDDAGTVPAGPACCADALGLDVRFLRQPRNQGPAAARNLGAQQARGDFLAFVDDDCRVARDWLRRLQAALLRWPGCGVGGAIRLGCPDNLCSAASHAILDTVYRYYNADAGRARFVTAANLALPADRFRAVGGFDPTFRTSEDRDFCARWLGLGFPLRYADDAQVFHDSPLTLREFCGRHYHYGVGGYRFRRAAAAESGEGFRLEPAKFYLELLTSPWQRSALPRALALGVLVTLSQAASTLGVARAWLGRAQGEHGRKGKG